ncbi:hypothetical protein TrVFT333_004680 [Trichoderma virens FT-333]|nr:hypothetical protein TrVFT333_004680 [Trichoderma virens FT-333]
MPQYIYINGYPGVGKLTIAKELEKLIPNAKIYHNHLFIDPVAPLVDRDSPYYHDIRTSFRRDILNTIATSETTQQFTWMFADSRSSSSIGSMGARDYKDAADTRGVPFISIILHCQLEENATRVLDEGRGAGFNTKLTDLEVSKAIRQEEEIYTFGGPYELELDVTNMAPK